MQLEQLVKQNILKYPRSYKSISYKMSRLRVLDYIFFVGGNGLSLAYTKDPSKGGYIVEPRYKKNGERKFDKPYSTKIKKSLVIPEDFFQKDIEENIGIGFSDNEITQNFLKYFTNLNTFKFIESTLDIYNIITDWEFLQPDWRQGLTDLIEYSLEYYSTEDLYKTNIYYPGSSTCKFFIKELYNKFLKEPVNLLELRKYEGLEIKNELPTLEEITLKYVERWNRIQAASILKCKEYLDKYKNKTNDTEI